MTANFSPRGFFVYTLAGLLLILCGSMATVHNMQSLSFSSLFSFIDEFSIGEILLAIPFAYILGHLLSFFNGLIIAGAFWLVNKKFMVGFVKAVFLSHTLHYAITKRVNDENLYTDEEGFWTACAKLQNDNRYMPAQYFQGLQELFNGLILVFLVSAILSFSDSKEELCMVYSVLTLFAYFRAKHFSELFVNTVFRSFRAK